MKYIMNTLLMMAQFSWLDFNFQDPVKGKLYWLTCME